MSEGKWAEHRAVLEAHQPFRDLEYEIVGDDGERHFHNLSGVPVFDQAGEFIGYHGIARDVSARRQAEQRIQYLATHDDLTGLPNRTMFNTVLNMAFNTAQRYQRCFALVFIDLDRFKVINDTLGHEAGDALLRQVARRLKACLRASDLVARLGGDEFVVLVQEITEAAQAAAVAQKILSAINQPLVLMGQECRVTASVGVSLYPAHAQDELTLMKNADLAMYLAKEEGKNNYQFFSPAIKAESVGRLAMEAALRRALERDELFLHYQPKLCLKTGRITGAEALLRWKHPELGMVSPAQFIPLAEETGLIVPIGLWVLRTACEQSVAWQRAGLPPVCVAVNLSPRQFNDERLLPDIRGALAESGLGPEHLELEITEGTVMQDSQRAARILGEIKALGIALAIDDFGTGYSSLAQIKRFPIDTIKVDRSFIRNLPQDAEDKAITQAILAIAKTLGLAVVAEGVETAEQESFLRDHACDQTQGYFFSKPIAADDFAALLRRHLAAAEAH
jgi:diguanylate cyclase (GGDEF)-like protein